MTDLKILNIKNKSKQYLFKDKLSLRRKSKSKLLKESFIMLFISFILLTLKFFIPQKKVLFETFLSNLVGIYNNFIEFLILFKDILLVLFIISSSIITFIILMGVINRVFKVLKRKTKKINF